MSVWVVGRVRERERVMTRVNTADDDNDDDDNNNEDEAAG